MQDPSFIYAVRFWVAPEAKVRMMQWLEGGHVKEVVTQPGFLWCRMIAVNEKDASGWEAYSMIYGVESREAIDAYNANTALAARFVREREPFAGMLRMERFMGNVVFSADK
jgi:hypothetical protein